VLGLFAHNANSLQSGTETLETATTQSSQGIATPQADEQEQKFKFEVTTIRANQTFYIPLASGISNRLNTINWTVDWGDESPKGVFNQAPYSSDSVSHLYSLIGPYTKP
jgi:hypothetical protein